MTQNLVPSAEVTRMDRVMVNGVLNEMEVVLSWKPVQYVKV